MSEETISVNSATGGKKGVKLARFDLIPPGPLIALAEHFGKGSLKYADRNWELGYEWGKSFAALQRHAWLFWMGEDFDNHKPDCPEGCVEHTGSHHLTAVAWHAFALMEWFRTHPELDTRANRPPANPFISQHADLLRMAEIVGINIPPEVTNESLRSK